MERKQSNRINLILNDESRILAIAIEKGIIDIDDEYDCENGRASCWKIFKDWKNSNLT